MPSSEMLAVATTFELTPAEIEQLVVSRGVNLKCMRWPVEISQGRRFNVPILD